MPEDAAFQRLVAINTDDFFESLGLARLRTGRRALAALIRPAAARFARQIVRFDQLIGRDGLGPASAWLASQFAAGLRVTGAAGIPLNGPLLFAVNHPGIADTVALFSSIPRPDLRIIASQRPFLESMTHLRPYVVFVTDAADQRMAAFRAAAAELRAGRAVLTFPAGKIEPDPGVRDDAADAMAGWSDSIGLLARLVPDATIIPTIVRGVYDRRAYHSPLTRVRKTRADRERMAAMLQVIWPPYKGNVVQIVFGPPVRAAALKDAHGSAAAITRAIIDQARALLHAPADGASARI